MDMAKNNILCYICDYKIFELRKEKVCRLKYILKHNLIEKGQPPTKLLIGLSILSLLLVGCVFTDSLYDSLIPQNANTEIRHEAEEFCKNQGFDDKEFVEDSIIDGKFYCVNKSKGLPLLDVEEYYQGVVYR